MKKVWIVKVTHYVGETFNSVSVYVFSNKEKATEFYTQYEWSAFNVVESPEEYKVR